VRVSRKLRVRVRVSCRKDIQVREERNAGERGKEGVKKRVIRSDG
jgi:hypothetical protein